MSSADLSAFSGDARLLWEDSAERCRALESVLDAALAGRDPALELRRLDRAIEAGLAAFGLPRGPINGVRLEFALDPPTGLKRASCDLVLFPQTMEFWIRKLGVPDMVFKAWVHESLHARQPFAPGYRQEHHSVPGFEEGMVEGLSRLIVRDRVGHQVPDRSYEFYVRAYRTLASAAGLEIEALWRQLWSFPPGRVSEAFTEVVAGEYEAAHGRILTGRQRVQLRARAMIVFARQRQADVPDAEVLIARWRAVLE